jgi:hypothetical protein
MTEKPGNLLRTLTPKSQERFLKDLNRLVPKHNILSSGFGHSMRSGELHKFTALDFEHARIGAAAREAAKAGGAASAALRKDKFHQRNIKMAFEFLKRRDPARAVGSNISDSDLKHRIGQAVAGLGRSASIEAIDDGLTHLKRK